MYLYLGGIAVLLALVGYLFDFKITPNKKFLTMSGRSKSTPLPLASPTAGFLASEVVPEKGYKVPIVWGDTGKKLVAAGGIDMTKYRKNYSDSQYRELLTYLTDEKNEGITLNSANSYFWVNTLWALGLTQKSDVLEKGVMGTQYKDDIGNFASTGGWTLGSKDSVKLFSSANIIPLTSEQQNLVSKISQGIYRPCCGNPTSFPDCNHGMAILGLIELMVSQGFSEDEVYKAALAFNSYWFTDSYIDLAYYFQTRENTLWKDVDPKRALSAEFSSAQGYQAIKKQVGNIPGLQNTGGSCGA